MTHSPAKQRVRLGFIGAGWWATTNHMPLLAVRGDVDLVAVCRPGREALRTVQDEFGFEHATEDYLELLDLDLDGVLVCSPHDLHYEHAKAALEHGLHVACEKPMTLEAHEAWELVELAERHRRHLLVPYGWHYKPFVQQARTLIDLIGDIQFAQCHMASPTKGFFGGDGPVPSDWAPTIAAPDPRTWQVKETGGGYAHGQITHSSALLFWLTGLRASTVSAVMTSPESTVDLYDAAVVVFDNGAIGSISGAATLPDDSKFQIDLRIFGSEGVLLLDIERERLEVRRHDGEDVVVHVPSGQGAYSCDGPPNRFVELLKGDAVTNDSPGWVAARSVELIASMHRSVSAGGTTVEVAR